MTTRFEESVERIEPTRQAIRVPWKPSEPDVISRSSSSFYLDILNDPIRGIDIAEYATKKAFLGNFISEEKKDWWTGGGQMQVMALGNVANAGVFAAAAQTALNDLSEQILEIRDRLRSVSLQIEEPADEMSERVRVALKQPDPTQSLGNEVVGDDWVEFFDYIADGHQIDRNDVADLAKGALSSTDQAVKSAAARALAVVDPKQASHILGTLLPKEENKYVRAAFASALESAAL